MSQPESRGNHIPNKEAAKIHNDLRRAAHRIKPQLNKGVVAYHRTEGLRTFSPSVREALSQVEAGYYSLLSSHEDFTFRAFKVGLSAGGLIAEQVCNAQGIKADYYAHLENSLKILATLRPVGRYSPLDCLEGAGHRMGLLMEEALGACEGQNPTIFAPDVRDPRDFEERRRAIVCGVGYPVAIVELLMVQDSIKRLSRLPRTTIQDMKKEADAVRNISTISDRNSGFYPADIPWLVKSSDEDPEQKDI